MNIIIKLFVKWAISAPFLIFGSVVKRRYYIFCSKHGYMDNPKYLMRFYLQHGEDCIWVYGSENERLTIENEIS